MARHFSEKSCLPQVYFLLVADFSTLLNQKILLVNNSLWGLLGSAQKLWINQEFVSGSRRQFSEILLPSAGTILLNQPVIDVVKLGWLRTNY